MTCVDSPTASVHLQSYPGHVVSDARLFPDAPRSDPRSKRAHESEYKFFQRVADPAYGRIRDLLNQWFDRFTALQDAEAVADLRQRFRAKQRGQFLSAFWELYLHELFARLGYQPEVHPTVARGGNRPDFLMTRDSARFYLEAVMPTPGYSQSGNQPASVETVTEYINEAFRPKFWLRLVHVIPGSSVPKKTAVKNAVGDWLDTLDWNTLWKGDLQSSVHPETELHIGDGWQIKLVALPLDPSLHRDEPGVMIFSYPGGIGYPDGLGQAVLPHLTEKATKYGALDAPLMLAMWVQDAMANPETAPLALFGGWFSLDDGVQRTGLDLRADRSGLWTPRAKTRGRACGVLAANSFGFGYPAVARALPRYWPNPWANESLAIELPVPTSTVSGDGTTVTNRAETISPADLFELPEDWPGQPFQNL